MEKPCIFFSDLQIIIIIYRPSFLSVRIAIIDFLKVISCELLFEALSKLENEEYILPDSGSS